MSGHLVADFVEQLYLVRVMIGVDIAPKIALADLVEHYLVGHHKNPWMKDEYFC